MVAPRALASSYSSSTITPAPSPRTKPSRSLSHGQNAAAGSSLREEWARADAKPPRPSGEIVDSAPPAIMTSASPYSIMRAAAPMQCNPVVHAVTMARFGPFNPYLIERWPEIMLMIDEGTKKGLIHLGPRLITSVWV